MYNWSTDIRKIKADKPAYDVWKIEQLVNFGLGKDKINKDDLRKNWLKLRLDPVKKKYLKLILWP